MSADFTKSVDRLEARLTRLHGSAGSDWIRAIPRLIAELKKDWGLEIDRSFQPMSDGYVASGVRASGRKVVLKLRYPTEAVQHEVVALRAYSGVGAVSLLEADLARGAILMEQVEPGIDATQLSDDAAIHGFSAIVGQIHVPAPETPGFPTVEEWGEGFKRHRSANQGGAGRIPPELFSRAEDLHARLLESQPDRVLLHGDLHHANLLLSERRGWLAVDPKGVVGEPAYEAGAFLRNPINKLPYLPGLPRRMAARIDLISKECGYPTERLAGWGFSQAVLSAIWALEDDQPEWKAHLAAAQSLLPAVS